MKGNSTEIFFCPNQLYRKELAFLGYLVQSNNNLVHINEKYLLPENFVYHFLSRDEILGSINRDLLLPKKAKSVCYEVVSKLPKQFAVIKNISNISVDFTIRKGKEIYFIEFHEQQHRRLTKKKEYFIYTTSFEQIKVPRFVQRLVKDVWRWKYLDNYQIIWWDWFEANMNEKVNLFSKGKRELFVPGKFSLSNFLNG